jgi:uncharacterized protein (TIGR00297 family)
MFIMAFLTLNRSAVVVALAIGILLVIFGRGIGFLFAALMVYFLALSAFVTYFGYYYKVARKLTQRERGAWNVIANGAGPLIFAAVFFFGFVMNSNTVMLSSFFGFFGSVAAITADKFSSELGVLNGMPKMIFTMKKVDKGVSGGVTLFGVGMGILAAFLIALIVIPFNAYNSGVFFYNITVLFAILCVTVSGLFGTLVDSMLGYFEEKGIGNKYTSNFFCSIAGGLLGMALVLLFVGI